MNSTVDKFWRIVERWETDRPRISLEFSSSTLSAARSYVGTVTGVSKPLITFRDELTEAEETMDFTGAEVRHHSYERIDGVEAFGVMWESEDGLESMMCMLTELRQFGKPT